MGLDLINVISDERHHGPFECAICQNLCGLDALVTTPCSHVFCNVCLEKWLDRPRSQNSSHENMFDPIAYKCPTCNENLDFQSRKANSSSNNCIMIGGRSILAQKLEIAQPLAYRVLRRIQVKCPLAKHGCDWTGDYEDLTEHLLSDTSHQNMSHKQNDNKSSYLDQTERFCQSPPVKRSKSNEEIVHEINVNDRVQEYSGTASSSSNNSNNYIEQNNEKHDLANSFKAQANAKFSSGNFKEARDLYTKAISIIQSNNSTNQESPSLEMSNTNGTFYSSTDKEILATLFANRAAAYLQLNEYQLCISDCNKCVTVDKSYIKAYLRMSKAQIEIGNFSEAYQNLYTAYHTHNPTSATLKKQLAHANYLKTQFKLGKNQYKQSEYAAASATFGALLRLTKAKVVILAAARADLQLGRVDQAMRLSLQVIRSDTQNAEGYEIRGHSMYFAGEDLDSSCKLMKEALRLDPDNQEAKITLKRCRKVAKFLKDARYAVFHRKFEEAVELFTHALQESHPLPSKAPLSCILHAERGEAYLRLKQYDTALQDATHAIYAREDHVSAWLVKTKALHGLERHEDAKEELDDLMNKWGSGNDKIRKASENANFQVRLLKRPDFYKLFGVSQIASEMEIKKQYKVKALKLHPDRYSGNKYTDDDRKKAAEQFKLLGEGLEILCDDFKRKLYDEGFDQEAIRERVAMAERAAHRKAGHHGGNPHHH